ncbi:leucine-rich repeat protein, partial [Methanomethylophilus alvi]|uniref:leucine-rich repeat protein n=1 Tax=Methanomethylophilus alvi TaxID=1291540 RepID=UPI0037DD87C1
SLTSVVIGNGVTSIGSYAFSGCTSLASIVVSEGNTAYCSVDGVLFSKDMKTLVQYPAGRPDDSYIIPDGVTSIGQYAFRGCTSLVSVTIPDGVTSIGSNAFSGCTSLVSVTIPDSVTSIGDEAFYRCSSLTSVTLPDGVTSLGSNAFSGCSSLASITIPDSVTSIGQYAFYRCTSLVSVTIPDSVTSIGQYAFEGCTSLVSVTIPDSVTSIGQYAFEGCTSLVSVTIPDSVTSIGQYAFQGCSSLTSVVIGNGVTSIGQYAFRGCTGLRELTIPISVNAVGSNSYPAFYGCTNIEKVTFTPGTGKGYDYWSSNSSSYSNYYGYTPWYYSRAVLKEVVIEDGVTSIGSNAFRDCTGLKELIIPDSVTSIGSNAFSGCTSLTSIVVSEGNTVCCSLDGVLFSKDMKTLVQYPAGRPDDSYIIPDSVTSIGPYAFYGCTGLRELIIPDSVASICYSVFEKCTSLVSVTIPDSVTSIGDRAFYGCSSLTSIILPDSVTSIGDYAFFKCTNVSSIRIGPDVSSIGYMAFEGNVFYDKDATSVLSADADSLKGGCFVKTDDRMVKVDGHMMSFYVDGKVVYRGVFVEGDEDTHIPDVPFRPGYICSWEEFELGTEDVSVNAVYVLRELTVSFDPNGGSGSMDPVITDVEHLFLRPENGFSAPDHMHMHFAGWAYSSDGEPIDFDGLHMVDDAVLYALWAWDQYDVVYKVDGEIVFTDTFDYGTEVTVRDMFQKTGYTVTEWSTDDVEVSDGKFVLGAHSVIFSAASTVNQYDVIYKVDGEIVFTDTFDYGTEVTVRDIFQKTGYTVTEWSTDDVEVTDGKFTLGASDVVFDAASTVNQYDVIFISDGKEFARYSLAYGSAVVLPDVVPSKDADVRYVYTFSGWDGYTEDMTVDGDRVFNALFSRSVIANTGEDGGYEVKVDGEGAPFSSETISGIVDGASADPSVTLSVSVGDTLVSFDNEALRNLHGEDADLLVSRLSYGQMTQAVRDVVGHNVAYSISFGPNRNFGNGTVTVTIPYVLAEGKDPDNLVVYYVAEDGTVEEIPCTYSEGYVTFSTDHFSVYAVMYEEPPSDGERSVSPILFAVIGVIIAIGAIGAVIVRKRRAV